MLRVLVWLVVVASMPIGSAGCTPARPARPAEVARNGDRGAHPETDPATDPAGRWRGRLSLYSAEINDLTMDLHLRAPGDERGGRAVIEITDEPGELHRYVTDLSWGADGAAVVIYIGSEGAGDASGLTFSGERVGADRIDGRLNGWGIKNARMSLHRRP